TFGLSTPYRIKEVQAVGQELGPAVCSVAESRIRIRRPGNRTAVCRHAEEGVVSVAEEDGVLYAPTPSAGVSYASRQGLCMAALGRYFLKSVFGEERDPAAIGRPKRARGIFGSRQDVCHYVIDGTEPKHMFAAGSDRCKDQLPSIGRNGKLRHGDG